MSLILALDTTNPVGSLALVRGTELLEEFEYSPAEGFCETIYQQIASLLARHDLKLSDIDLFASAAGPGSFTGGRISMTAAKGLAEMHGKLVAPISNLLAVASQALPSEVPVAPLLDVRSGLVAAAVYSPNLECLLDPVVAAADEIARRVAEFGNVISCGPEIAPRKTPRALAAAIARLAEGRGVDPAEADIAYIRRAETGKAW